MSNNVNTSIDDVIFDNQINDRQAVALFTRAGRFVVGIVEIKKDPVITTHEEIFDNKDEARKRYMYRSIFNGQHAFETKA